jgi:hypothetical protein
LYLVQQLHVSRRGCIWVRSLLPSSSSYSLISSSISIRVWFNPFSPHKFWPTIWIWNSKSLIILYYNWCYKFDHSVMYICIPLLSLGIW